MSQPPAMRLICPNSADILAKLKRRLTCGQRLAISKQLPVQSQLLDTETDALWRDDMLLLRAAEHLVLITPTDTYWLDVGERQIAFVDDIEPGALRTALARAPALRSLRPRLEVSMRHSNATLLDDQGEHCAHLNVLTLRTAGGCAHLVEIRTIPGQRKATRLATAQLAKLGAISWHDRRDGVKALLNGAYHGSGYLTNPGVDLQPQMSVKQAATAMISTYIAVARHNEAGILADWDSEYLHDYRVSLRRVRSIISLFKGTYEPQQQQSLNNRLADLMRQTNRLRDLDVYLLEQQDDFNALPTSLHQGLAEVFSAFATERQHQWQQLCEHLQSRHYRREMRALQRAFARPEHLQAGPKAELNCRQHSARLITRRYRKVCRIAATIDEQTADERVHQLRLQCKKLRYLLDLSGPLFNPKQVKKIIKSLKRLQDNLGRFNDYSVQQVALQQFLEQQSAASTQMIEAVGALIAVKHQLQSAERQKVMRNFADFHSPATDARFNKLFGSHALNTDTP